MNPSTVNLLLASDLHLDVGGYDLGAHLSRYLRNGYAVDAVVLAGDLMEAALPPAAIKPRVRMKASQKKGAVAPLAFF